MKRAMFVCSLAGWLCTSIPAQAEETVTYTKDIAPILWNHCAGCHRPGEVGPFSLLSYKDTAKRAEFLEEQVVAKKMPPWKAEPGYGSFHDDRRLDPKEIDLIARWVEQGAEEGNPADLPPMPRFPEGWQLGTPDLVLKMPEPFEVPASGRDVFRCFVIPSNLDETRTVAAVEFRPGNRKVVHHALFYLNNNGAAREKDAADPGPGFASFGGPGVAISGALGGWAPGAYPRRLPDGVGRLLRKGSDLVLQVHYHPNGKAETDQSAVGLYFTKTPAQKILMGLPLANRRIEIPAGETRHEVGVEFVLPTAVHAYGITPHMHWIGREMKVSATLPDGTVTPLIWIKDWDFNWQGQYLFAKPVALPKDAVLKVQAFYDNSAENPRNPNSPPKLVRFGEQTTDEMCLCGLQVVPDERSGYAALLRTLGRGRLELLRRNGGSE